MSTTSSICLDAEYMRLASLLLGSMHANVVSKSTFPQLSKTKKLHQVEFKAEENISKDTSDRLGMILHKEVVNKSKSSKKQA